MELQRPLHRRPSRHRILRVAAATLAAICVSMAFGSGPAAASMPGLNHDFNGDGLDDIAAITPRGDMQLFPGGGRGKLEQPSYMWPQGGSWLGYHAFTAGDFNNDGKADVAAITPDNNMQLFLGDGRGKLEQPTFMWPRDGSWIGYKGITAGDFNADGRTDIAAITPLNDLQLFRGNGQGKLEQPSYMWPQGGAWIGYKGITAGDFNNDGKADIAAINAYRDMQLFLGDGLGSLENPTYMWPEGGRWAGYWALTAGDYNNDGKADIAAITSLDDLQLFRGDGQGKLEHPSYMWPQGGGWHGYKGIA